MKNLIFILFILTSSLFGQNRFDVHLSDGGCLDLEVNDQNSAHEYQWIFDDNQRNQGAKVSYCCEDLRSCSASLSVFDASAQGVSKDEFMFHAAVVKDVEVSIRMEKQTNGKYDFKSTFKCDAKIKAVQHYWDIDGMQDSGENVSAYLEIHSEVTLLVKFKMSGKERSLKTTFRPLKHRQNERQGLEE